LVWGAGMGGTKEALDVIDEALRGSDPAEERCAAELMCIKGELLLPDDPELNKVAASRILRQPLAEAQGPEKLAWELRTSMSLACLLREEKFDRATWQLQFPLHGRFTQGFMTAELVEAKRLLDKLDQVCSDGREICCTPCGPMKRFPRQV
jgi:hypothetical protein